jgi:hypothetical protein
LIGVGLATAEARWHEAKSKALLNGMQIALAILGLLIFAGGAIAFWSTRHTSVEGDISSTLTRNPDAYALSLGHVLDLTPASLAELRVPVIGTALTFLLGTLSAFLLRRRAKHFASNVTLAMMMAAFFFCAHLSLGSFGPYLSSRSLAEVINREYQPGDAIVINGEYEGGASINFYTRKMVYILNGRSANLEYGSFFEDAPRIFLDNDGIAQMWRMPNRVFLFTDSSKLAELTRVVGEPSYTLAESGSKLILTNQQSE